MHYDPRTEPHGLKYDPFKAIVVPRPVGWIGTLDAKGNANLAPYSFFNAVSDQPPIVMFSSAGRKDSLNNIEATGEFTCSLATWDLRHAMNLSSATLPADVDEFPVAGLEAASSANVRAPRVAGSPAALECKLWKTMQMPADPRHPERGGNIVVFGEVVGVYISDACIREGRFDTAGVRPVARMGYMDFSVVTPETTFELNRPQTTSDGRGARVDDKAWDGVYR